MRVIYNRLIPFPGFEAINLFGIVFARAECRPVSRRTLRHEAIHTAQMRETGYVGFYLIYAAEWLCHLVRLRSARAAYYTVRFEREAYRHQDTPRYLTRRPRYAWRQHGRRDSDPLPSDMGTKRSPDLTLLSEVKPGDVQLNGGA